MTILKSLHQSYRRKAKPARKFSFSNKPGIVHVKVDQQKLKQAMKVAKQRARLD